MIIAQVVKCGPVERRIKKDKPSESWMFQNFEGIITDEATGEVSVFHHKFFTDAVRPFEPVTKGQKFELHTEWREKEGALIGYPVFIPLLSDKK